MYKLCRTTGLAVLAIIMLTFTSCSKPSWQSFDELVLPDSPNTYLICTKQYCAVAAHQQSPIFNYNIGVLEQKWQKLIQEEPRIETVLIDNINHQYLYVQRTKWLRFPDIIQIKLVPLAEGKSTILMYSRSVYGHYDFQVNKKRLQKWLGILVN